MKTKLINLLTGALMLASAPALLAQDNDEKLLKPYVAFGYNFAHGHSHDMTQTAWGGLGAFSIEAGFEFKHDKGPFKVRPNVGYARILGNPVDDVVVYDLLAFYFGFDAVFTPFDKCPGISLSTGPSFHQWSVEQVNALTDPRQGARSTRFGWRFGVGYEIRSDLRVDLTFTQAEWRSTSSIAFRPGFNPSNPAYFTLKASYSF